MSRVLQRLLRVQQHRNLCEPRHHHNHRINLVLLPRLACISFFVVYVPCHKLEVPYDVLQLHNAK